jgi:DNA repair protein RecO (recombination protein O)
MANSPAQLQPAFVLHRRDYRNTSLLLELFTLHDGRLPVIAKGAKTARGGRTALLQPFRPLLVGLAGRGEIRTLTQVEAEGRAFELFGRLLYCGFYLNELLMRLVGRHDPHPDLFGHYLQTLGSLAAGEAMDASLREFEVQLLTALGYALSLTHDSESGEPVEAEVVYQYILEQGPVGVAGPADARRLRVHGRTLLSLHNRSAMDQAALAEARGLMRGVLAFYLGDKPLKSRELFMVNNQPIGENNGTE